MNDAKETELCAIADDHFKEIKDVSMKEVARAQYATDALDVPRMTFTQGTTTRWIMLWRMFWSSIQAFCRKGLLCFLLISEIITGEQHLFSKLVTSRLQLMTHHQVCVGLAFLATAVFILVAQQGFQTRSESFGSLTLSSATRRNRLQLQVMSAFQTKWSGTVLLDKLFWGYEGYQKVPCSKGVG